MSDRNASPNGLLPLAQRGELPGPPGSSDQWRSREPWTDGGPGNPGRRRAHRIPWEHHEEGPVLLEVQQPGGTWHAIECTLVDLGAGGSGLLVPEPLEPGARVRVTIQLPARLGREPYPDEGDGMVISPWTGQGHIVHQRHTPDRVHDHVPEEAHRPHHHGVVFQGLEDEAERRLMTALYGPLPAGWAIERTVAEPAAKPPGGKKAGASRNGEATPERYAVLKDGKRVAWGFGSYDRARSRAWSLHMDEVAVARRQHAGR